MKNKIKNIELAKFFEQKKLSKLDLRKAIDVSDTYALRLLSGEVKPSHKLCHLLHEHFKVAYHVLNDDIYPQKIFKQKQEKE